MNFFEPSFKLKDKIRTGAKVKKTYYPPATPCARLLGHPAVSQEPTAALQDGRVRLDPIALLHTIRECQASLARIAGRTIPEDTQRVDGEVFMRALPVLWKRGEARPTNRQKPTPARTRRTGNDPFASAWHKALKSLKSHPESTAKMPFAVLQASHPGDFTAGQLRTLQRRVRDWRAQQARALILPGKAEGPIDEWLTGEAAE